MVVFLPCKISFGWILSHEYEKLLTLCVNFVETISALININLHTFAQLCASSFKIFVSPLQVPDAFYNPYVLLMQQFYVVMKDCCNR